MRENAMRVKIIFGLLAVLGLILSVLAHFEPRFPGDLRVTLLFQSVHSQPLLTAMKGVSYVTGDWKAAILVIVSGIIVWRYLGGLEGGMVVFSGLISTINEAFKILINRPRPPAELVDVFVAETGKSFPSGHAFLAVVVLGMIAYLLVAHQTKHYLKMLTASVFIVLILWVGASRIYLGAHWMSDVIGGYVIGSLFLALEIWLYRQLKLRTASKGSQAKGPKQKARDGLGGNTKPGTVQVSSRPIR